jgi:hypothetical protein
MKQLYGAVGATQRGLKIAIGLLESSLHKNLQRVELLYLIFGGEISDNSSGIASSSKELLIPALG